MRTFVDKDGKAEKFWTIDLAGKSFTVAFGKVGARGRTQSKNFPDEATARKEHDSLIAEKLAGGYQETTSAAAPSPAGAALRKALEEALTASPDDLASHMAYADLLMEQGDPRGELIQAQLALEEEGKSAAERKRLQKRERELLKAHEREWLGELAPLLLDQEVTEHMRENDLGNRARWARGWVDDLRLWLFDLPAARALARCPAARLLRRLHVDHCGYADDYEKEPGDGIPDGSEYPTLYPLQKAPFLPCLRVFQIGETVDFEDDTYDSGGTAAEGVSTLVRHMTGLEELYLLAHEPGLKRLFALPSLANLRTLQVYHCHEVYPLAVLAKNSALGRLTTLRLHPGHSDHGEDSYLPRKEVRALLRSPHLASLTHLHLHASDLGDEGCIDIVRSGILKRLKVLDLRHGCVTDKGARALAECPDVRRLELLSLEDNQLTDAGRELLQGLGIPVRCKYQSALGEDRYLWSGDME